MRKEHPILYSTPMVVAKLAGRKTQTRRVKGLEQINGSPNDWGLVEWPLKQVGDDKSIYALFHNGWLDDKEFIKCPFGKPGDLFWGRETFYHEKYFNGLHENCFIKYKADYGNEPVGWNWKPSIFMPKEAARIWEEVVDIRVERLQDITEEDAIAEGVEWWIDERLKSKPRHYRVYHPNDDPEAMYSSSAYHSYQTLWMSINGIESWNENPWVWVLETEILSTTGRPNNI